MAVGEDEEFRLLVHCFHICTWYRLQSPALQSVTAQCYIVYAGWHRYYTALPDWRTFIELYELADPRLPKHYFELIPEGRPCRLYFDIECDDWNWLQPGASKELLPAVFREVVSFLKYAFPLVFEGTRYDPALMMYSHACDDKKFSLHATGHYRCTSNEHLKLPIQNLVQLLLSLKEEYPLLVFKDDKNKECTVFDPAVYTKNRVFRLLDSSKHGSNRVLLPLDERRPFLDYAVSYVDGREPVLPLPSLAESRRLERRQRTTGRSIAPVQSIEPGTIEESAMQRLLLRLQQLLPQATWYRNASLSAGVLGYFCGRGQPCVYGEVHRSNNGFLTYNPWTNAAFAYCHNSACAQQDGVEVPELESPDVNLFALEGHHVSCRHLCPVHNTDTDSYEPEVWLKDLWRTADILMIKSPTGTGKTTFVKWARSRLRGDACVTSIGVRRSFCDNTAPLLELENYRAVNYREVQHSTAMVIQLDSLMKNDLPDEVRVRDLLILDEETAKLSHYFEETMMTRQRRVWKREMKIRQLARKVLVLCADLDQRALLLAKRVWPHRRIEVVINDYKPSTEDTFTVKLYESRGQWQAVMERALEEEQNVAFASCSKKEVRRLYREFKENYNCLFMTSDQPYKVREQYCSQSQQFSEFQWLGYTSTMTVGVDINMDHFDMQFGYVTAGSSTAREFMQMLARVRQLRSREIHLFVNQKKFVLGSMEKVPSQDHIRDMILSRVPAEGDVHFQQALQRCQLQLDNCDLLKVKEDFLEQSVFYLWERLRSRANIAYELKRICKDKGYVVEEIRSKDSGLDEVPEAVIISQEIETLDEFSEEVSQSLPAFDSTGSLRESQTIEEVLGEQKQDVSHRLQLSLQQILPEHVECFGWDHMQQETIKNVNLMFQLSLDNLIFDADDKVTPLCLQEAIQGAQGSNMFSWENYEVLRARKAKMLYVVFGYLLQIPYLLLNDGSDKVSTAEIQERLDAMPDDIRDNYAHELQLLFELERPVCMTKAGYCLRSLNNCLERYCDMRFKREKCKNRGTNRDTYIFSIERTMRDRWLEYFSIHHATAKFDLQVAMQHAQPVQVWTGETVPMDGETDWPDPYISRYKKRKIERLERLSSSGSLATDS